MTGRVKLSVLFFGVLKDITGMASDQLEVGEGATLGWVFDQYAERFPRLREASGSVLLARNQEFARRAQVVEDGDEIAFLPPVSGGSGRYTQEIAGEDRRFYALTREPIDARELGKRLLRGEDGAVVTFEGVVRNNTTGRPTLCLEYECYEPMAIKMMRQIGGEIAASYEIDGMAMVHRLGRLQIGETSVAIVVTAAHRKPAFAAALEAINRLKRVVPIWKKEYFADGEVWVEGEWDASLDR